MEDQDSNGIMSTFSFQLRMKEKVDSFQIVETGQRAVKTSPDTHLSGIGCGRTITWSSMNVVPVPAEFNDGLSEINTKDIQVVPQGAENVRDKVDSNIKKVTSSLKFWKA